MKKFHIYVLDFCTGKPYHYTVEAKNEHDAKAQFEFSDFYHSDILLMVTKRPRKTKEGGHIKWRDLDE